MIKRTDPYQDKYPTEKDWVVHAKLTFRQQDLLCCGTKELHGIQGCWVYYNKKTEAFKYEYATPTEFIEFVKNRQMYNGTFRPYYTFTEASGEKNTGIGKKIVDYIEKHKLGEVAVHGPLTNHNSGNKVTLFVWMIDNTRVKNHVTEVDTKAKAA